MSVSRILLVHSQRLSRAGFKHLLVEQGNEVVEAESLASAAAILSQRQYAPDIALIEFAQLAANGATGGELERLRTLRPSMRLVVLSKKVCTGRVPDLEGGRLDGWLIEDISSVALHHSLELVRLGEKVIPGRVASLLAKSSPPQATRGRVAESVRAALSRREMEILYRLSSGHSNKRIAQDLNVTEDTVKAGVSSILKKLALRNRTQVAIWARKSGFHADDPSPETPA